MSTLTYTALDGVFDNGQPANGTDVRSRTNEIKTFLEGNNLEPTNNIKMTVAYPWLNRHSWNVTDAANDNLSLVVGAVMAANKYGFRISTAVAQVNSAMAFVEITNSGASVPCYEAENAGTGSTFKATNDGDGHSFEAEQTGSGATTSTYYATQAGTGALYEGSLRGIASLNSVMRVKNLTTITTADNTATETEITGLTVTLPANFLKAGTMLRGVVWGQIDTPGAGVPSATIKLYHGGTSGTTVLNSGAVTHGTSLVDSLVKIEWNLTCITVGGAGTIEAQGMVTWGSNTAPANRGLGVSGATGATNDTTFTVDTTTAKDITLTFKWGSAVAGATFKARSGYVELIK